MNNQVAQTKGMTRNEVRQYLASHYQLKLIHSEELELEKFSTDSSLEFRNR